MMDIVDRHFAAENAHDVEATLATYTDDVIWDDITHPACPVQGKVATAGMYGSILDAIPDIHLESVWRIRCGKHVIDEAIVTGHMEGHFAGTDGEGAPIRFRLLHRFDIRDGLIERENAWFDAAGVRRQVEEFKRRHSVRDSPG